MRHNLRLICIVIFVVVLGCNSRPATVALQGEVTYDGRPVDKGQVVLEPIENTSGASSVATIANGRYETHPKWGLLPNGVYLVRITAYRKTGKTERIRQIEGNSPADREIEENFIPATYNSQSTLTIRVADLPDKNKVDFHLGKAPAAMPR